MPNHLTRSRRVKTAQVNVSRTIAEPAPPSAIMFVHPRRADNSSWRRPFEIESAGEFVATHGDHLEPFFTVFDIIRASAFVRLHLDVGDNLRHIRSPMPDPLVLESLRDPHRAYVFGCRTKSSSQRLQASPSVPRDPLRVSLRRIESTSSCT